MWMRMFRPFQRGGAKIVFETATLSEPGGRVVNEDFVGHAMAKDAGCWALADGLGGHRGGEIASRLGVDAAIGSFEENPAIAEEALNLHLARGLFLFASPRVRNRQLVVAGRILRLHLHILLERRDGLIVFLRGVVRHPQTAESIREAGVEFHSF